LASIGGAAEFAGGVFILTLAWSAEKATFEGRVILCVFGALAIAVGVYLLAGAQKAKVILHSDAIETVGLLSTRRLRFQDIGAKQRRQGTLTNYLLYPKRKSQRKIRLEMAYGFDTNFLQRLKTIPDADSHFFKSRPN